MDIHPEREFDMINRFEEFTNLISSIYKNMLRIRRNEMAKFGLKGPHAQCLVALSQYPEGVTMTQLCEICDLDKAAISRSVAEMEECGVILPRSNGENRYRALLVLSDKGYCIVNRLNEIIHDLILGAGYNVSEEDRETHYMVLRQVNANLAKIVQYSTGNNSKGNFADE